MDAERQGVNHASSVRVLHLIDGLGGGGSERWIWDIVRFSDDQIVRHFVVTLHPDDGDFVYADQLRAKLVYRQRARPPILFVMKRGIERLAKYPALLPLRKFIACFWRIATILSAWLHVLRALATFRPHVIHAHTFHGFTTGMILKTLVRLPLVHTVPALISQMNDAGFWWLPPLYRRFHGVVDYFFTGASLSELDSLGVPSSKVRWIRGTIDLDSVSAALACRNQHRIAVRSELGIAQNSLIILTVGRLHPSKGYQYGVDALPAVVSAYPSLHWLILGEGSQRSPILERAAALGIEKHVHLIGYRQNPLPYYAASDLYLRTPIYEAENLSSYCAMAASLPVVGFDTGCETELVRKVGHGVLVPTGDVNGLANAIIGILSLHDRGRSQGCLGAEYARKHLDIREAVEDYRDTYVQLARARR